LSNSGTGDGYGSAMVSNSAGGLTAGRIVSPRLALDPLRPEDADELATLLDDLSLHRFIGGKPAAPVELRARLERQVRGRSPDGKDLWLNWVVRERRTGQIVGTMQATIVAEQTSLIGVLAWVIGSAHQGQGIATEAAGLMASWLRQHGIVRLRAHIHPEHVSSMAVAAAIGLTPTDTTVRGERRWESDPTA
jgi:RimJ/RimL family protein N-acetyltransferase